MINTHNSLAAATASTTASQARDESRNGDFASLLASAITEQAKSAAAEAEKQNHTPASTAKEAVLDAREELMKILQMTPAERIRYTMLQEMGLTEDALATLPPEERMRIEAMIEEEIERQLAGQSGNDPHDTGLAALNRLQR